MNKSLLYFDHLCKQIKSSIIKEDNDDTEFQADAQVTVDATATVNGKQIPVTVNASEDINIDNVNIDNIDININIKNLKLKLEKQLEDTKKKAYASRLYSTKVGNNPDALRDYGYFLGQKNILMSVLKDLNDICINIETNQENNENE